MGVVLAAGFGTRLRPLTLLRPKSLCPVDNVCLLDRAVASVRPHVEAVAANAHYLREQVVAHLAGSDVHLSVEDPGPLGSAGALGHLRGWIGRRDVLVRNADAFLADDLTRLVDGWDRRHPRVLVRRRPGPADFGTLLYVGACLLPARDAARLPDAVSSLYDLVWRPAWDVDRLETVEAVGAVVDCGTPADYLRANLLASGGVSVVGEGAVVEGRLDRCVVWPGARVGPDESLHECIRAGTDVTVDARRPPLTPVARTAR